MKGFGAPFYGLDLCVRQMTVFHTVWYFYFCVFGPVVFRLVVVFFCVFIKSQKLLYIMVTVDVTELHCTSASQGHSLQAMLKGIKK